MWQGSDWIMQCTWGGGPWADMQTMVACNKRVCSAEKTNATYIYMETLGLACMGDHNGHACKSRTYT